MDGPTNHAHHNFVVDILEELPDITFEYPTSSIMITAYLPRKLFKPVDGLVGTFSQPTRERICYKLSIKIWIKQSIQSMMEKPVAHTRFMYLSWFGVIYPERLIAAMEISVADQITMHLNNIIHEGYAELLDVFLFSFP